MKKIILGFKHFQSFFFQKRKKFFSDLSNGQSPEILFITCSDSRIDPNLLTSTEPGDLFVIRNAGNIIPPYTEQTCGFAASIEFAIKCIGVKHIIICGHSDCGAMKGALDVSSINNLPNVTQWLVHSKPAVDIVNKKNFGTALNKLNEVTQQNVLVQIQNLRTHPVVAKELEVSAINIHGWVYDIKKGSIVAFDESKGFFVPVLQRYKDLINNG